LIAGDQRTLSILSTRPASGNKHPCATRAKAPKRDPLARRSPVEIENGAVAWSPASGQRKERAILYAVRAGLVADPCDWPWSSARAHLFGKDDPLVKVAPLLAMIGDWRAFLNSAVPEAELRDIRRHARTGRPLGDETFLARLERIVGRALRPKKPGPKKESTN
jgi:hypothetical protein